MSSPYLGIPHLTATQRFKETTVNTAIDWIDGAQNGKLALTVSGTVTLTTTPNGGQALAYVFYDVTGTGGTIIVPTNKKRYIVRNGSSGSVLVKTSAGTGITITSGQTQALYCDGTDVVATAPAL